MMRSVLSGLFLSFLLTGCVLGGPEGDFGKTFAAELQDEFEVVRQGEIFTGYGYVLEDSDQQLLFYCSPTLPSQGAEILRDNDKFRRNETLGVFTVSGTAYASYRLVEGSYDCHVTSETELRPKTFTTLRSTIKEEGYDLSGYSLDEVYELQENRVPASADLMEKPSWHKD